MIADSVRFGVVQGFGRFDPEAMVSTAVRAESLGFDLYSLPDHLHTDQPTFEPWTALAFVAAATRRLLVMPNVLGLPYRHPAVTAKMAETLDRLSNGRLVLGLGVGGYDSEFSAFGLAERTAGEKVAALAEAVRIIRGLWSETTVTFTGEHFQLRGARIEPKPAHRIPMWIGAYRPRALRVTAALADGWIPSIGRIGLSEATALRTAVLASRREAGRGPEDFTCATNLVVSFQPGNGSAGHDWRHLSGNSDAIAERLVSVVQAGFTVLNVGLSTDDAMEEFASDVIPRVHAALPAS